MLVGEKSEIDQQDATQAEDEGIGLKTACLKETEYFTEADADISRAAQDQAVKNPAIDPINNACGNLLATDKATIIDFIDIEFMREYLNVERIFFPIPIKEISAADSKGDKEKGHDFFEERSDVRQGKSGAVQSK